MLMISIDDGDFFKQWQEIDVTSRGRLVTAALTLAAFLSPSVRTPSSLLSRKYEISSSVKISGSSPTAPST